MLVGQCVASLQMLLPYLEIGHPKEEEGLSQWPYPTLGTRSGRYVDVNSFQLPSRGALLQFQICLDLTL